MKQMVLEIQVQTLDRHKNVVRSNRLMKFQRNLFHGLFVFNDLRLNVVVCFVDIGVIVDHHCITFLSNDMEAKQFLLLPICGEATHTKA